MEGLDKKYKDKLAAIKKNIQNAPVLAQYLDEEEDELYQSLREEFEPHIHEIYSEVADHKPLQLEALENELIGEAFEGLYSPRILGYSVLRGAINDHYKYYIPQNHFRDILLAIVNSANFDVIKLRIGQAIQIGFALSSDIWITNIIDQIENKKVKLFLAALKVEKYRDLSYRKSAYLKFKKQFESLNFQSSAFPSNIAELKMYFPGLKEFLIYRAKHNYDNKSLKQHIISFLENSSFPNQDEYLQLLMIIGMFYDLDKEETTIYSQSFDRVRKARKDMELEFFTELKMLYESDMSINIDTEKRLISSIDNSENDEISKYLNLLDQIHSKGYIHEDSIEAIRSYYYQHEGLSLNNECLREVIVRQYKNLMENLGPQEYVGYFEINKTIGQYIGIFSNQKFNQKIKEISLKYIRTLLKHYTDKRGRDYQDIKKFVISSFLDYGFMKEKELVELFKTKRKKKTV